MVANAPEIESITCSVTDVAKALGIGETTVRRLIEQGQIPAIRIGRRVLILRQQLLDRVLLAAGHPEAVAEAAADARDAAAMQVANDQRQAEAEAQFKADREANNKRSGAVNPLDHVFRV